MSDTEVRTSRAESYLRIQRRDIFEKVCYREDYKNSGSSESSLFRKRLPFSRDKKRTGETKLIKAIHLEAANKGFSKGFTDYQTYDPRHNRNYVKNNNKFKLSRFS